MLNNSITVELLLILLRQIEIYNIDILEVKQYSLVLSLFKTYSYKYNINANNIAVTARTVTTIWQ